MILITHTIEVFVQHFIQNNDEFWTAQWTHGPHFMHRESSSRDEAIAEVEGIALCVLWQGLRKPVDRVEFVIREGVEKIEHE